MPLRSSSPHGASSSRNDLPATSSSSDQGWQPAPWQMIKLSSLRDTLHAGNHSRDFILARNEYLRSRVLVCGILFALLTPLWLLVDFWLLPASTLVFLIPGRFFLLGGLVGTLVLAWQGRGRLIPIRLATGLLIVMPAAFYALTLISLPPSQMHLLVGYSFIPYLLVAVLSIFPLTLSESAIAGLGLIILECAAQQQSGIWLTPAGWQGLWLLGVLLAIAMTANHFHLGLLLRLYRQATHDPLTGLLNRRALTQSLAALRQRGGQQPLGLILLDIDHFKRLNDEHGHAFGDMVLQRLGALLRAHLHERDYAARYGGEEFLLVLADVTPPELLRRAEQLRAQVANLHLTDFDQLPVRITISAGLTMLEYDELLEEAVRRADAHLYQAKASGRNRVVAPLS